MITRDMVQGFIDGLKAAGALDNLEDKVRQWAKNHPRYPASDQQADMIASDVGSYKK